MFWKKRKAPSSYLYIKFTPQKDITAYELAKILSHLYPLREDLFITKDKNEIMEECLKRHFQGKD